MNVSSLSRHVESKVIRRILYKVEVSNCLPVTLEVSVLRVPSFVVTLVSIAVTFVETVVKSVLIVITEVCSPESPQTLFQLMNLMNDFNSSLSFLTSQCGGYCVKLRLQQGIVVC